MTDDRALRPTARYSTLAIILHWLIAALLFFEIGLGWRMEAARGPAKFAVFQLHKSIGITILLLVAIRLLWRLAHRPPRITAKPWERGLAHLVHTLFYVLLFALPISGWIIVSTSRIVVPTLLYGTIPWPHFPGVAGVAKEAWHGAAEFVHVNLITVALALLALHVAGALKHHFVDRDGDIAKMAPGAKPGAWADWRLIAIFGGVVLAAALGRRLLPIAVPAPASAPAIAPAVEAPAPAVPEPPPSTATPAPDIKAAIETEAKAEAKSPLWVIGKGSALRFHTSWSGAAIDGGFNRFDGHISFDPEHLDRARVAVRIDTTSIFSGDEQRDETLKSEDWFSTASFASAVFNADRFRKAGADRYVASGTLRIKGATLPVTLPFTLKIDGDKAVMRGTATVDRTAYKIGQGDYAGTSEIPAAVTIEVMVNATRK